MEEGISNGYVTAIHQDQMGMLWFGTASGLNRYDGYTFRWFLPNDTSDNHLVHQTIWALEEDQEGNLWIGTNDGLSRFHLETETFHSFRHRPIFDRSLSHNVVESIATDPMGQIWIGTANGLNVLRNGQADFDRYFYSPPPAPPRLVKKVFQDSVGDLWIGSLDTLYQYQGEDCFVPFALPTIHGKPIVGNYIREIAEDHQQQLWIGTEKGGIYVFDKRTQAFRGHYCTEMGSGKHLSHNQVKAILEREPGEIWIGTGGGGLNICQFDPKSRDADFKKSSRSFGFSTIQSLSKDRDGNVWIGTYYDGLYAFKQHKKPIQNYHHQNSRLKQGTVNAFAEEANGDILISTNGTGLQRFDPQTETFHREEAFSTLENVSSLTFDQQGALWLVENGRNLGHKLSDKGQISTLAISQSSCGEWAKIIYPDSQGQIWIGSRDKICRYDPQTRQFAGYDLGRGSSREVEHIHEDEQGQIWVATHEGVHRYDAEADSFLTYPSEVEVLSAHNDQQGRFWIGTAKGMAIFDKQQRKFQYSIIKADQPGYILSIQEDRDGYLWLSTDLGLFRYHPSDSSLLRVNKKDGLINQQLLQSSLYTRSGELYISGISGFSRFQPAELEPNPLVPPVVITRFLLFNKEIEIGGESPLQQGISHSAVIQLEHWQNDLSFEFAALDYTAPGNNMYRYQLLGHDKNRILTSAQRRFAHYTNLSPGTYIFQVEGANSERVWNQTPTTLRVIISPPWWRTVWAYAIWVGLIATLLYLGYRFQLRRQLAKAETERLKELDTVKNRLFTNITHEFRNPLTIILGITENLAESSDSQEKIPLNLIYRNGQLLLELVNQMLDLAKLESGKLQLVLEYGDIVQYIRYLMESFHSYAASKDIQLQLQGEVESCLMDYDPIRFLYILSNLLSNAIKFSPPETQVDIFVRVKKQLKTSQSCLEIRVVDQGIGIPPEQLPHIFSRFYQVDDSSTRPGEGTGIGLTLVKELVHLMGGEIQASSVVGKGSEFQLWLPISHQQKLRFPESASEPLLVDRTPLPLPSLDSEEQSTLPLMLIVEDNLDLVHYLVGLFRTEYRLAIARNGQEGVEQAISLIPDLILTDVMMPEKDGLTMTVELKQHDLTSHIPIIMLTAKVDVSSRLSGFKTGADAYIAKPFLKQELLTRVEMLLKQQARLKAYYRAFIGTSATQADEQPFPEDPLLAKIDAILTEYLDDHTFGVEQLSEALSVSVSGLYKKITALSDLSPSLYIRNFRLAHAKAKLEQTNRSIAEIAFETGFSDQRYFSRIFKKELGMTPTAYRSAHRTTPK